MSDQSTGNPAEQGKLSSGAIVAAVGSFCRHSRIRPLPETFTHRATYPGHTVRNRNRAEIPSGIARPRRLTPEVRSYGPTIRDRFARAAFPIAPEGRLRRASLKTAATRGRLFPHRGGDKTDREDRNVNFLSLPERGAPADRLRNDRRIASVNDARPAGRDDAQFAGYLHVGRARTRAGNARMLRRQRGCVRTRGPRAFDIQIDRFARNRRLRSPRQTDARMSDIAQSDST